ncbi:MAG: indolepyruvate ferredoxin oxidoreductase subunit alpha [Deltaproteobacteria bacterium]|nr:indolepyruvate ferredoxin oxidoreductase subunit alpha [Deltaproteobacteria bacterium]
MKEKKYAMGDTAIARGALEAGVRVVAGYPGTPATEIVDECLGVPGVHVEWANNEKVAFELCTGASLCHVRAMPVMKHNGTNFVTDFLMHVNFTGIRGGLVLISADDPGGLSSQNEEDTRILVHQYAHLPIFDPCSPQEAKAMVKEAFDLSEKTELVLCLRPVTRVCHARGIIEFEDLPKDLPAAHYEPDRERFIMSAVEMTKFGGLKRPQIRHRWLNEKQPLLEKIMEESPYNWAEKGEGKIGLVGCGMGYTLIKEAEQYMDQKLPLLKLGTLPLPRKKIKEFVKGLEKVVIFEETEPFVEGLFKKIFHEEKIKVEVLGRSGFVPADGELNLQIILDTVKKAVIELQVNQPQIPTLDVHIPIRTRTQCVGCNYRGILNALKQTVRKHKGIVAGDIGCHDAGSFRPLELQSTIYCMGSSVPMASGMVLSGVNRPVFAFIGDSTFYHNGILGLMNAATNKINVKVILGENTVTAMTGFQPHPGTGVTLAGEKTAPVNVPKLAESMGISYRVVNPYDIEQCREALEAAVKEDGPSLIVSSMPCYLLSTRRGQKVFEPREVRLDEERCNGCMLCINDFGCPAISFEKQKKKVTIDPMICVGCALCVDVCKRGAIS